MGKRLSKLELRFVLSTAAIVFMIVLIMTLILVFMEKRRLIREFEHRALIFARTLAQNSELGVYTEYEEYLKAPLGAILANKGVLFGALYDREGRLIAGKWKNVRIGPERELMKETVEYGIAGWKLYRGNLLPHFIDAYVPVRLLYVRAKDLDDTGLVPDGPPRKKIIGVARVGVSIAPLKEEINMLLMVALGVFALFSIAGTVASVVIGRRISSPIVLLAQKVRRLAQGDLSQRIEILWDDEIGELAEAFNKMAENLQRSTLELKRRNEDMEMFLYSVSHDLKTPIASIQGMVQLLERKAQGRLDEKGMHYIERIKANIQWMEKLIQGVLTISRLGREKMTMEEVPMEEVVRTAVEVLHDKIQAGGITVEIQPGLPVVWGVKDRLVQVMVNLIGNAVKFMDPKKELPWIRISWYPEEDMARFCVEDNGVGIPENFVDKVFGLFQKLDYSREGMGMGLAVVKRIVERHGGNVQVTSEEGKGSEFCFTLIVANGNEEGRDSLGGRQS